MGWLDILIILILIFFIVEGISKKFIPETLDFLSFLLAFFISLRFYNLLSSFFQNYFQIPHSLATVLGFICLWFIVEAIFFTTVHLLLNRFQPHQEVVKRLNKLAWLPSGLRGVVIISIILVLIGTFPVQPKIKQSVYDSKLGFFLLTKAQQLEVPLKNVFGGITEDTLTFLTVKPEGDESVNLGFKTASFKPNPEAENQMFELVNQERAKRGIKTLIFDQTLSVVAREHSGDMFTRGYFSHYTPEGKNVADRASAHGIKYLVIGENLAYAPNLMLAHNGLMNSKGHRDNILSLDFNKIGIGIMDGGVYGLMVTQVFSN